MKIQVRHFEAAINPVSGAVAAERPMGEDIT